MMKNYYGFNFLWMFTLEGVSPKADERAMNFIAKHGFNFVRLPMDYRIWTKGYDYYHPDEKILEKLDDCIRIANDYGMHVCINLHRAPGYCVNKPELERHNLWKDKEAQDAFVFLWEMFAKRYHHLSKEQISFDLVNEPSDEHHSPGCTHAAYDALVRRTTTAIRAISPDRAVVADGMCYGHHCVPSLADFNVIQSGRGYMPFGLSHYKAEWNKGWEDMPNPVYPGRQPNGEVWDKSYLRTFYAPWRKLEEGGVRVHIGEFGCYNKTPDDIAFRWLTDLVRLYGEYGWGYCLWNFEGSFGIIGHNRPGALFEACDGYMVDRKFLELLKENRK